MQIGEMGIYLQKQSLGISGTNRQSCIPARPVYQRTESRANRNQTAAEHTIHLARSGQSIGVA